MMAMNLCDIAILSIKNANYFYIITRISKSEAVKPLQNIDLTEKKKHYKANYQEQYEAVNLLEILLFFFKKTENYKSKKYIKSFEAICKNRNKNYKIWLY